MFQIICNEKSYCNVMKNKKIATSLRKEKLSETSKKHGMNSKRSLEQSRDVVHRGIRTLHTSRSQRVVNALHHVNLLQVPSFGALFIVNPCTWRYCWISWTSSTNKLERHGTTSTGQTNRHDELGFGKSLVKQTNNTCA